MAAPTYSEDLTDIHTMESTTDVDAIGGGGAGLTAGVDFAVQGTNSVAKTVTGVGVTKGILGDNTAGITMGASDHVFVWVYSTTQGVLETLANGGMRVTVGTSTANYNDYYVAGSDTYKKGGHICWAVRYSTSTPSPGSQTGTPGAAPQHFGGQLTTTGTLRADDLAVDVSRYGTGAYITAGEVANPATFAGFATQNDAVANQWGILTEIPGGYGLQGRFVVGQNNAGTATAAYFDDSTGATVTLWDTPHSQTDFTQIIIDHASTTFNLAGATIKALGANNPGKVVFNNASTVSALNNNTFDSVGITTLQAGVTAIGNQWKKSGQITQNGATITDGTIRESSAGSALLVDTNTEMATITGVSFVDNNSGNNTVTETYYFDESDATATDPNAVWTNDSNAFDGSTATLASTTTSGSVSSDYLKAEGTTAISAGDKKITQVRARLYANSGGVGNSEDVRIYTNNEVETLGDVTNTLTSAGWGDYTILTAPSSGWTYADLATLEARVWHNISISGTGSVYKIELDVTATDGHSVELTATGSHDFTDITFSGGGGTPGSNLVASTGSAIADVYNNSGGAITINVSGGDSPSVRNAAGSTTTVVSTVTLTVTDVPTGVNMTIVNSTTRTELQHTTSTGADITYSHAGGETVDILFMSNDYDPNSGDIYDLTLPTANSSIKANIADDLNYENPV